MGFSGAGLVWVAAGLAASAVGALAVVRRFAGAFFAYAGAVFAVAGLAVAAGLAGASALGAVVLVAAATVAAGAAFGAGDAVVLRAVVGFVGAFAAGADLTAAGWVTRSTLSVALAAGFDAAVVDADDFRVVVLGAVVLTDVFGAAVFATAGFALSAALRRGVVAFFGVGAFTSAGASGAALIGVTFAREAGLAAAFFARGVVPDLRALVCAAGNAPKGPLFIIMSCQSPAIPNAALAISTWISAVRVQSVMPARQ